MTTRFALWIGIDARSLAALRIGVALVLLADLLVRCTDLTAHYTDDGVLPRASLAGIDSHPFEKLLGRWHPSLLMLSGSAWWAGVVFAAAIASAAALLVGYRTRLATLLCWVLTTSIQVRNPLIVYGGDHLLRLLLFWNLFLPWGARWSVDGRRGPATALAHVHACVASAALLLQVALVYTCSAALKTDPLWHGECQAVYWALHNDIYARPAGLAMRDAPEPLLHALTHTIMSIETGAPFLLFCPAANAICRALTIPVLLVMQAGFGVSLQVGIFPWISAAALWAFVPTRFWRRRQGDRGVVILSAGRGSNTLAALALVLMVWWNLSTLEAGRVPMPSPLRDVARVCRLDQAWTMFAPYPLMDDGWFIAAAHRADGSVVDAWTGADLAQEKPDVVSEAFPNHRWRKLMINLMADPRAPFREGVAAYLCRRSAAQRVELVFMQEVEEGGPYERVVLADRVCGTARAD